MRSKFSRLPETASLAPPLRSRPRVGIMQAHVSYRRISSWTTPTSAPGPPAWASAHSSTQHSGATPRLRTQPRRRSKGGSSKGRPHTLWRSACPPPYPAQRVPDTHTHRPNGAMRGSAARPHQGPVTQAHHRTALRRPMILCHSIIDVWRKLSILRRENRGRAVITAPAAREGRQPFVPTVMVRQHRCFCQGRKARCHSKKIRRRRPW